MLFRHLAAPLDATALDPTPHDKLMLGIGFVWIAGVLSIDSHSSIWTQRAMGVFTWLLLIWVCSLEGRQVRAQVVIVVAYATTIEYVFSGLLHVYVYRLDNVPLYVPPGHGLVYGAAITMARTQFFKRHAKRLVIAMLVADGLWALWGVTLSPRSDWLGVFWFLCMVVWVRFASAPTVYVGAFIVVSYLEIVGTSLGTWRWSTHDPIGWFTIGNPPSGIAGGYCWFDTAALILAPVLLVRYDAWRAKRKTGPREAEVLAADERALHRLERQVARDSGVPLGEVSEGEIVEQPVAGKEIPASAAPPPG